LLIGTAGHVDDSSIWPGVLGLMASNLPRPRRQARD
jgi:hypothetical protein